jgi:hypothetical protein
MEAIEDYLSQHPDAADSEQGIAKWWVPAMGLEASAQEVAAALEGLRELDRIERKCLPGGRVIYRARRTRHQGVDENGKV